MVTESESIDRLYRHISNRYYSEKWSKQEKAEYHALLQKVSALTEKEPISLLILVEGVLQKNPNTSFNWALHEICRTLEKPADWVFQMDYQALESRVEALESISEDKPVLLRRPRPAMPVVEDKPVLFRRKQYTETNLF